MIYKASIFRTLGVTGLSKFQQSLKFRNTNRAFVPFTKQVSPSFIKHLKLSKIFFKYTDRPFKIIYWSLIMTLIKSNDSINWWSKISKQLQKAWIWGNPECWEYLFWWGSTAMKRKDKLYNKHNFFNWRLAAKYVYQESLSEKVYYVWAGFANINWNLRIRSIYFIYRTWQWKKTCSTFNG